MEPLDELDDLIDEAIRTRFPSPVLQDPWLPVSYLRELMQEIRDRHAQRNDEGGSGTA
jgi:hypothetical protein